MNTIPQQRDTINRQNHLIVCDSGEVIAKKIIQMIVEMNTAKVPMPIPAIRVGAACSLDMLEEVISVEYTHKYTPNCETINRNYDWY